MTRDETNGMLRAAEHLSQDLLDLLRQVRVRGDMAEMADARLREAIVDLGNWAQRFTEVRAYNLERS